MPEIRSVENWNRMEFSCVNDRIVARVNGAELASVQDGNHNRGSFRITVGGPPNVAVRGEALFDNLVIRGP